MREAEFDYWLGEVYVTRKGTRMSVNGQAKTRSCCRAVERHEGDLDRHVERDGMRALLERFRYSKQDHAAGRAPRHAVPTEGHRYNVTATYRSALRLYQAFSRAWPAGTSRPAPRPARSAKPGAATGSKGQAAWPAWDQPGDADLLPQARLVATFVRFLHPDIVGAIAEDNDARGPQWSESLRALGIDPSGWIWPGSPCAFPGVRRYAGSREIKDYWAGGWRGERRPADALVIDDNTYPKHAWSFALRGRPFQQFGPKGYALAHLLDHKAHGGRLPVELHVPEGANLEAGIPGLYTSAANACYVPRGLLKPTDFEGRMRNLLQRRAMQLYGQVCAPLPPGFSVREAEDEAWALDRFAWAEPVGEVRRVPRCLRHRAEQMERLLGLARAKQDEGESA